MHLIFMNYKERYENCFDIHVIHDSILYLKFTLILKRSAMPSMTHEKGDFSIYIAKECLCYYENDAFVE